MKEYRLIRNDRRHETSRVEVPDGPSTLALHNAPGSPYPHSPDGHAWGYGGSGPTQLALDILWDVYGEEPSKKLYFDFRDEFLESLDSDLGLILETHVRAWAKDGSRERHPANG